MAQRLQAGEPPWIRGSIEYTEFDRNQMWLTASRITTTCWFYLAVWTKGSDKLHLAQLTPKFGMDNNNEEQEPEDCEMYSNEVQESLGQEDEGISPTLLPTLLST